MIVFTCGVLCFKITQQEKQALCSNLKQSSVTLKPWHVALAVNGSAETVDVPGFLTA